MITRKLVPATTKFVAGDGSEHDTLAAAQRADLIVLLSIAQSKHIVDTLTTGPKSIVKARAVNGGKKPRKPRVVAEQFALPVAEAEAQSKSA
jgi:hypothetical protein